MGKKGYERFINNFTINHFENSMNATFQAIIGPSIIHGDLVNKIRYKL